MKAIIVLFLIALAGCASATKNVGSESASVQPTPVAPVAPEGYYYVHPGDTAAKIAAAHNIVLADLVALNPSMDLARLKVGQEVRIKAK